MPPGGVRCRDELKRVRHTLNAEQGPLCVRPESQDDARAKRREAVGHVREVGGRAFVRAASDNAGGFFPHDAAAKLLPECGLSRRPLTQPRNSSLRIMFRLNASS